MKISNYIKTLGLTLAIAAPMYLSLIHIYILLSYLLDL